MARPNKLDLYRRLVIQDPEHASDEDLLTVLLSGATSRTDPRLVARGLLAHVSGELTALDRISDLSEITGLTGAAYVRIVAATELCKRAMRRPKGGPTFITTPQGAYEAVVSFGLEPCETLIGLYLDRRHRLLGRRVLSRGSLEHTIVDPREVLRPALTLKAACVILVHNHPSGDPEPSRPDAEVTERCRQAGDVIGIELLDHIVIAPGGFQSMRELGHFPPRSWHPATT